MEPRIETLKEKKLIGKRIRTSLTHDKTMELWRRFMPRRKEIPNAVGQELYSVQVFGPGYYADFNPLAEFEKWAAVEVTDFDLVPQGMETITLPAGLYAVFIHKGPASKGPETFRYIYETWLPKSAYVLDDRPHFAVMGAKYRNDDPDSEEEIWVPVMPK